MLFLIVHSERRSLKHEAQILADIKHKHVVKLHGVRFTTDREFCLVMEYMTHGSCRNFFENNQFKTFDTTPLKYRITMQVNATFVTFSVNAVRLWGFMPLCNLFLLIIQPLILGFLYSFNLWTSNKHSKGPGVNLTCKELVLTYFLQVVETMIYLHGITPKQVLHLDLKSANVLLDKNLNVKVRFPKFVIILIIMTEKI